MIMMITGIALGVLTLLIVMTITGRMNYASELESQLSSVLEEALWNLTAEKEYTVSDTEEFLADVVENLAASLDAETGLSVRIQKADMEKGLLSVEVVRSFHYPGGAEGHVSCSRTVLLNSVPEEESHHFHTLM